MVGAGLYHERVEANLILRWKEVQDGLRNESSCLPSLIQSGRTFTNIFHSDFLQGNRVGLLVILPSVLFQSCF